MRHGTKCLMVERAGTPGMRGADAIDLSSPSVPRHYHALFFARRTQRLRADDLYVGAHPLTEKGRKGGDDRPRDCARIFHG